MVPIFAYIFPVLGYTASFFLYRAGRSSKLTKELIEKLKTTRISMISTGLVEISAQVTKGKDRMLKAPISGKECVHYAYAVEEKRTRSTKNGTETYWATIRQGSETVPFYVDDGSGEVLIEPKDAAMQFKLDEEHKSSWGKDPPSHVMEFCKANGVSFEGLFGINKSMRYKETHVGPKDKLFIIGYASKPDREFMISKGDKKSLFLISDSEEKDVIKTFSAGMWVMYIFSILLAIGSSVALYFMTFK